MPPLCRTVVLFVKGRFAERLVDYASKSFWWLKVTLPGLAFPCSMFPEGQRLRLIFREEQESITPGQAVVLYQGDDVLGGGVIEEVLHEYC